MERTITHRTYTCLHGPDDCQGKVLPRSLDTIRWWDSCDKQRVDRQEHTMKHVHVIVTKMRHTTRAMARIRPSDIVSDDTAIVTDEALERCLADFRRHTTLVAESTMGTREYQFSKRYPGYDIHTQIMIKPA